MRKTVALALFACCLPVCGWGPEGHDLVVRIAEAQLTPAARAGVAEILGPDRTLLSVASWADSIRNARPETGPWHYVDIPINRPSLDMERDCPKGDCVIAKIEEFRKKIADRAAPPDERREALMFLVHFVGDMHQPLHCSDNHDKGGNEVPILFFDHRSNLHSVWDSGLLGRLGREDDLYPALERASERNKSKWSKGTVEDWANEAHKASQKTVYGRLPKAAAGSPIPLGLAYERKADPLVKQQIEKAGARLAAVLNASLQ